MDLNMNNVAVEFNFRAKFKNQTQRVNFYRMLYGYKRMSNYGKYIYFIEGLLSNLKFIKPAKSVIILSIKDADLIRQFFIKNNVHFNERFVILNKKELKDIY